MTVNLGINSATENFLRVTGTEHTENGHQSADSGGVLYKSHTREYRIKIIILLEIERVIRIKIIDPTAVSGSVPVIKADEQ